MFLAGLEGQPVDVYKFYEDTGVDGYNLIASIGAFILVIGILLELGNAAYSWHNGLPARGHDPWGGSTLEWFALSPPAAAQLRRRPRRPQRRAAARHPRIDRDPRARVHAADRARAGSTRAGRRAEPEPRRSRRRERGRTPTTADNAPVA